MRTKFFDDVVSLVTWRGRGVGAAAVAASASCHAQLVAACQGATPCLQVVLLGSGLDSRPWRLNLPPGVRWFELDRADVLEAKQVRLKALGAQLNSAVVIEPAAAGIEAPGTPRQQQQQQQQEERQLMVLQARGDAHCYGNGIDGQNQLQGQQEGEQTRRSIVNGRGAQEAQEQQQQPQQAVKVDEQKQHGAAAHPLRALSWQCCAADLQHRGWSRGLVDKGLDPSQPVLWVLEGLLYYLEEPDVRAVLKEAAEVSGAGSFLAASVLYAPLGYAAASTGGSTPASGSMAPGTPEAASESRAGQPFANAEAASAAGAASGGSSGIVTGGRAGGGRAGEPKRSGLETSRPARRGDGLSLWSEFKWRCREEVPKFFQGCGWHTLAALPWLDAAKSYGFPAAEQRSGVYFVTAALGS